MQVRAPREYTDEQLAAKAAAKEAKESKQAEVNRQQAAVDVVLADKVCVGFAWAALNDAHRRTHRWHAYTLRLSKSLPEGKAEFCVC